MTIICKGKYTNIDKFISCLKSKGYSMSVAYPEAYRYVSQSCDGSVKIDLTPDYIDFSLIQSKDFRAIEISFKTNKIACYKKRNSTKAIITQQISRPASSSTSSHTPSSTSSSTSGQVKVQYEVDSENEYCLGEYETLELYEDRISSVR